ncbi:MAG: N-acetylmuramoyl-L-alanine amidase [Acidobacteriota bacterium]
MLKATRARRILAVLVVLPSCLMRPCAAEEAPAAGGRSLRTIVLDAGHGDEDGGVAGPSGTLEKDITADVCRRVARIFSEQLGTQRVVITRDDEGDVSNRTSLANGSKGNVFVSIHVASSVRADDRGARVYTMSPGLRVVELAERRLRPRARRTISGGAEAPTDLRLTPWAIAQGEFLAGSAALASRLSAELAEVTGSAPVAELPIAVLSGARMPAVLVEVGFLSNPEEEDRLRSDRYRELLARAVFRGIVGFSYGGALLSEDDRSSPAEDRAPAHPAAREPAPVPAAPEPER